MRISEKDLDSIIKPRISMLKTNMSGLISFFNDETLNKGSTDNISYGKGSIKNSTSDLF